LPEALPSSNRLGAPDDHDHVKAPTLPGTMTRSWRLPHCVVCATPRAPWPGGSTAPARCTLNRASPV